jgi:hypothetical protein
MEKNHGNYENKTDRNKKLSQKTHHNHHFELAQI